MRRAAFTSGSACAVLAIAVTLSFGPSARASFHLWKFDQISSNADGTQQFIEMSDNFDGEQFFKTDAGGPFGPGQLFSGGKAFTFPNDLPLPSVIGHDTAGQHVLLATSGFFPRGLVPDFILPGGFFSPGGDTLKYTPNDANVVLDSMTFGSLPTNGTDALFQTAGSSDQSTGPADPHNFTGEKVSAIPLPSAVWAGLAGLIAVAVAQRRWPPLRNQQRFTRA